MQALTVHAKGTGIDFAIHCNVRSTTWHDVLTNKRGKKKEEFLISNQLHIANIESNYTTFQTCRGASNIDLTILNNTAIKYPQDWAVYAVKVVRITSYNTPWVMEHSRRPKSITQAKGIS